MTSRPIFVSGASGFVGSAVLAELTSHNYAVQGLVNRASAESPKQGIRLFKGSLSDIPALEAAMQGCGCVIHLVGIIMEKRSAEVTFKKVHVEGTANVIAAAQRCGIKRYIHMSALGSRPGAASEYHRTKFAAEEIVRRSNLDWTIFRPSLIHGPSGEFMKMEARWARHTAPPFLFMPYFGAGLLGLGGAGKLQPVWVNDVARAFVAAIANEKSKGEVYPVAGPDRLTWPELHRTISKYVTGKPKMVMPIPAWVGRFYAAIGIANLLGFNRDQVVMSQEDNIADIGKLVRDFGWTPKRFEDSLASYAQSL